MCLSTKPGTPFGPAALWFGVRRRVSRKIDGMMWPINIGIEEVGVGRTCQSHGNGARRGIAGSGESDVVSIFLSCVITSDGEVRRRPNASSRRTDGSVGMVGLSGVPSEVRRMDLSATLGFFTNMRIMALPYFSQRRFGAWRMRRRATFLSLLK